MKSWGMKFIYAAFLLSTSPALTDERESELKSWHEK